MDIIVNKTTPEFVKFVEGCQALITENFEKNFKLLDIPTLEVNNGRRYFRIEQVDSQRSVFAFIDRTNGDVLKAAGWKAPAKHARGNIFDDFGGLKTVTAYGPAYLK